MAPWSLRGKLSVLNAEKGPNQDQQKYNVERCPFDKGGRAPHSKDEQLQNMPLPQNSLEDWEVTWLWVKK